MFISDSALRKDTKKMLLDLLPDEVWYEEIFHDNGYDEERPAEVDDEVFSSILTLDVSDEGQMVRARDGLQEAVFELAQTTRIEKALIKSEVERIWWMKRPLENLHSTFQELAS